MSKKKKSAKDRMASPSIDELVKEASSSDSSLLLEFFQSNLPFLKSIHLKDIRLRVLDDISLCLHGTMLRETDWMAFLNELGIVDNRVIVYIKFKSKWREEYPIYLALSGPLMERLTFGDVIQVIIKHKRLDALLEVKPFVEGLLNNPENYWIPKTPTAPEAQQLEKEDFQGESERKQSMKDLAISEGRRDCSDFYLIKKQLITVFILHTDEDVGIAEELRLRLKQSGFAAKTLSDFDFLLLMNRTEVIAALLTVVDFVVPIISKSFLRQIRSGSLIPMNAPFETFDSEENFTNDGNNRYIYQLLLNEFIQKNCRNFRVRSVIVPDFVASGLEFDILLTNPYKLWDKLPNFMEMLKKTKQFFKNIS